MTVKGQRLNRPHYRAMWLKAKETAEDYSKDAADQLRLRMEAEGREATALGKASYNEEARLHVIGQRDRYARYVQQLAVALVVAVVVIVILSWRLYVG